jgi:tungstate transport system permease protein
MGELAGALRTALDLVLTADPTVMEITGLTLAVSAGSTLIAGILFIPLACLIHSARFPGKGLLVGLIQALYSLPTVLAGLLVFLVISRRGPLGFMQLLFTPSAIILAEVVLIAPVVLGLVISALGAAAAEASDTIRTLGAGPFRTAAVILGEARSALATAMLMSFGRAISEVGAAMMVGGNIAGRTRTLTTAISLGVGRGETAQSMALGIILMALALLVSLSVHLLSRGRR